MKRRRTFVITSGSEKIIITKTTNNNRKDGDISRLIISCGIPADIFYHNRQVAAHVAKLVLCSAFGTSIVEEGELIVGQ